MEFAIVGSDVAVSSRLVQAVQAVGPDSEIYVASSYPELHSFLTEPDVPALVICEINTNGVGGFEFIEKLSILGACSMVVADSSSKEVIARALTAGANGYLTKDLSAREYEIAIRQIFDGECPISTVAHGWSDGAVEPGLQRACTATQGNASRQLLSDRELQVLKLMAQGEKTVEIANTLSISQHTVANHCRSIYKKMEVNSRCQAVGVAYKYGLV